MADIFGNTQVPRWLENAARPADGARLGAAIGTGLAEITTALQRDPNAAEDSDWLHSRKGLTEAISEVRANQTDQFWKLKTAQMQNNIAAGQARTAAEVALANDRFRETSAWMEDAPKLSAWATATPEVRQTTPPPTVTSKTGIGIVQRTKSADEQYLVRKQAADNQSVAAKQKVQDNADLIKRFNALDDPVTREQIRQMKDPLKKLQALALAEEAQKTRKANEANQARADAEARGETPTTTITQKGGVTETYKAGSGSKAIKPVFEEHDVNGKKIWTMTNPQTGSTKILTDKDAEKVSGLQFKITGLAGQIDSLTKKTERSQTEERHLERLVAEKAGLEAQLHAVTPSATTPAPAPGGTLKRITYDQKTGEFK